MDPLQEKIERAKAQLSRETRQAIEAVAWRGTILVMRAKKGYTFEQLGDLELETELLLCGLLSPEDYPKEIEKRMKIPKTEARELVAEMNALVFTKIKEEMIRNSEQQKKSGPVIPEIKNPETIKSQTEKPKIPTMIVPQKIKEEVHPVRSPARDSVASPLDPGGATSNGTHPLLTEKFFNSFKTPSVSTEHTLNNLTNTRELPSGIIEPEISKATSPVSYPPSKDPYRLSPDE